MPRKTTQKKKMGRPRKEIDFQKLDALCHIQCTEEEIASVFDMHIETLKEKVKEATGKTFLEYFKEKRSGGKASLRRMQWKKAEGGDTTMLIWLGKNMLKQADKNDTNLRTDDEFTVSVKHDIDSEQADAVYSIIQAAGQRTTGPDDASSQ